MDIDRVADPHPEEGTGHLSVEGPVTERRSLGEPPLDFDAQKIDADRLRLAPHDGRRQVIRFARNVRFHHGLRCGARGDDEFPLHAGLPVSGDAAEIDEIAGFRRAECDGSARSLAGDARRSGVLIWKDNVVLGALAVGERELYDLALDSRQDRIDLALYRAANSHIDHSPFGDA